MYFDYEQIRVHITPVKHDKLIATSSAAAHLFQLCVVCGVVHIFCRRACASVYCGKLFAECQINFKTP